MNKQEMQTSLYTISPMQKVMNYLITGFIFGTISIQYAIVPALCAMISSLCFYLGLRMLRNENKYFQYSSYLSVLLLTFTFVELIMFASPYVIPQKIIYFFVTIQMIQTVMMGLGLYRMLDTKLVYAIYFIVVYLIMTFITNLYKTTSFTITITVILFVIQLYLLKKIYKYIIEYKYDTHLSHIRVDGWKIVLIYLVCTILCANVTLRVLPMKMYEYTDQTLQDYSYLTLLDQKSMNEEEKNKGYIYDYDENFYLYVYELEIKLDKKYTSFDIELEYGLSLPVKSTTEVLSLVVFDGMHSYEFEYLHPNYSLHPLSIASYHVPVNPEVKTLTIQLAVKIDKLKAFGEDYLDSLGESILRVYGYQYLVYPYREPVKIASFWSSSTGYRWEDFEN